MRCHRGPSHQIIEDNAEASGPEGVEEEAQSYLFTTPLRPMSSQQELQLIDWWERMPPLIKVITAVSLTNGGGDKSVPGSATPSTGPPATAQNKGQAGWEDGANILKH